MPQIQVGLGERSYPIIIESGCLDKVGTDLAVRNIGKRYAVIADDRVASLFGQQLTDSLNTAGIDHQLITFPNGEASKNLQTMAQLGGEMVRRGFDRHDAIIALGGGVTGDLAGYLAASYMRGIPFVQIPTTLLAQVDSSVGGKTGVDIPEGKNLIGAFYQPRAVYIDTTVLQTLPRRELLGGLAEVVKYGIIRDKEFFEFLAEAREGILALEPELIERTVETCCLIKAAVVSEDEREGDVRRILNYGHTIGHAVEAASQFTIIHGLAVAIGMVAAARIAQLKSILSAVETERIIEVLKAYDMPTEMPKELDRQQIKQYLQTDKKVVGGKVFFVLPDCIGHTRITADITEEQIDTVLS